MKILCIRQGQIYSMNSFPTIYGSRSIWMTWMIRWTTDEGSCRAAPASGAAAGALRGAMAE